MIEVSTEVREVVVLVNINGHEHELNTSDAEDLRDQLSDKLGEVSDV